MSIDYCWITFWTNAGQTWDGRILAQTSAFHFHKVNQYLEMAGPQKHLHILRNEACWTASLTYKSLTTAYLEKKGHIPSTKTVIAHCLSRHDGPGVTTNKYVITKLIKFQADS